jgi:hypothetical protein
VRLEDEIRAALRDVLLPELRVLHEDLQALRAELVLLRGATGPMRSILLAGMQRLEERLEAIERGARRPIPCPRGSTRCRPGRRR